MEEADESSSDDTLNSIEDMDVSSNLDYNDPIIFSPIFAGIMENDTEKIQRLIEAGKSININDNNGNTPLHVSVLNKKYEIFQHLLNNENILIDSKNFYGETPLFIACKLQEATSQFAIDLIRHGADINLGNPVDLTPIHVSFNTAVCKVLIEEYNIDINSLACDDITPLNFASIERNLEKVCLLLYYGADPTIPHKTNGRTPFLYALENKYEDIQRILIDYEDILSLKQYDNVLYLALLKKSPLATELIKKGANVNYYTTNYNTLALALKKRNFECFSSILNDGNFKNYQKSSLAEIINIFWLPNLAKGALSETEFKKYFYALCNSRFLCDLQMFSGNYNYSCIFSSRVISMDLITTITICLLGEINLTDTTLEDLYTCHGYCNLFKFLLHIVYDPRKYLLRNVLIYLIAATHVDITDYLKTINSSNYHDFDNFSKYVKFRVTNDEVPSLVEFARNKARVYINLKYSIRNTPHFYTVLKTLNIPEICKQQISFERKIY